MIAQARAKRNGENGIRHTHFRPRNCQLTNFQPELVVRNRDFCYAVPIAADTTKDVVADNKEDALMIFADKLIDLRKKNGWSQEELADKLGVSRQAVSKWESAQSIPDLNRVLAMADLFSVSTDYLLRDEVETPTTPITEASTTDSPLRTVTMEEANQYLALQQKQAPLRALSVSTCVVSPIPLLLLTASASETAVLIGVIVLLLLVAAAVVVFIRQGMENLPYEFLSKEDFDTAYGITGMVRERQAASRAHYTTAITAGVVMCILAAVPILLGSLFAESTAKPECILLPCVSLTLAIVAAAVYLFVRFGAMQEAFSQLLQTGDYTSEKKAANRSPLIPGYWCLATAIYLFWSFQSNAWDKTWVVWPVAGVLFAVVYGIVTAVCAEKQKKRK